MSLRSFVASLIRGLTLFLAVGCAMFSLVAQFGRWSVKADGLSHAAPLYLAGSIACLVLWICVDRRTRTTLLLSLAALFAAGALMAPELWAARTAERVAPREETLKLIQFNLFHGNIDPEGTAEWLIAQDADILVLEEAFDRAAPIVARLAGAYPHRTFCEYRKCGTTILSKRRPLHEGEPLRVAPGSGQLAWARFNGQGGPFTVVGTHYVWPDPITPQWINRDAMRRNVRHWPIDGLILTGDFNSTPWSFGLRRQDHALGMERRTRALFSWPTRAGPFEPPPVLAIDQVYAGADWKTVSVERGPRLGSDHYPVVVVLTR